MMTLRLIWERIRSSVKLIISGLLVLGSVIAAFGWHFKNKKVIDLQQQLAISQAKFRVEALAEAYKVTISELNELRKEDLILDKRIATVEDFLSRKLRSDMTVEEIAQKFKEIGIEPKMSSATESTCG